MHRGIGLHNVKVEVEGKKDCLGMAYGHGFRAFCSAFTCVLDISRALVISMPEGKKAGGFTGIPDIRGHLKDWVKGPNSFVVSIKHESAPKELCYPQVVAD